MLSNHQATEEEKTKICNWKYEGEYALYNTVSYEEMKNRKFGLNKIAARWPAKAVAQFSTFSKKGSDRIVPR